MRYQTWWDGETAYSLIEANNDSMRRMLEAEGNQLIFEFEAESWEEAKLKSNDHTSSLPFGKP
jgi:hypothetical protein